MSRFQEIWSEQQKVVERDESESVDNYSSMVIYIVGKSHVSFACGAPMPCRAGSSNYYFHDRSLHDDRQNTIPLVHMEVTTPTGSTGRPGMTPSYALRLG